MPMDFVFYPKHEHRCPHVGHCPHLGGAALGTLVLAANERNQYFAMLRGQLDEERRRNTALFAENQSLREQLEQTQRELKAERQQRFCKDRPTAEKPECPAACRVVRKRRGAPKGHPGWFRPRPATWDRCFDVAAPRRCPHCGGDVRVHGHYDPDEHLQEDVVDGRRQVVLYRHVAARCRTCRKWVQQPGEGELLLSKVGPHARAMAAFLHHEIGVSSRKVPRAVEGLTGLKFTAAAVLGFETKLAQRAKPLAEDIASKIASTEGAVNADETYWSCDGKRAYFWLHATGPYVHFRFSLSRAGRISRRILGADFTGVLVTDCYSGYDAQTARAKQKCLAHLTRAARDWQKVVPAESLAAVFFADVQAWVTRACRLHRLRRTLPDKRLAIEMAWLRKEQQRLETTDAVDHHKARKLQGRLCRYRDDWLIFLDDPRVPPTNNRAEQLLRQLVILRKLTFGHRSLAGAHRMARLTTVKETAKQHGHRVLDFFYHLAIDPARRTLKHLYSGP
jgi:transposase